MSPASHRTRLSLIVIGLAAYSVYVATYVPAMLVAPAPLLLLVGFVLQVVCALAAAFGLWRRQPWAAAAVMLLGAAVAFTALIEGFVLGIVAWLHALLTAVLALALAFFIAGFVRHRPGLLAT